jgi:hypothetical protein
MNHNVLAERFDETARACGRWLTAWSARSTRPGDAVQETWLRFSRDDRSAVENLGGRQGAQRCCFRLQASVCADARETPATDDERARTSRLLLRRETSGLMRLARGVARCRVGRHGAAQRSWASDVARLLLWGASVSKPRRRAPVWDEHRAGGPRLPGTRLPPGGAGAFVCAPAVVVCVGPGRGPTLADIIGARRVRTVAMISRGRSPAGSSMVVPGLACPTCRSMRLSGMPSWGGLERMDAEALIRIAERAASCRRSARC